VIAALAGQGHSAKRYCRMFGVAPSGYFHWCSRPPSIRALRPAQLNDLIADIHHASMGTYGYRRVTAELRLGYEISANHKAVESIMRRLGLQGVPLRKAKRRGPTGAGMAASDLVLRRFSAEAPNRLWLTDITEHPTREGKVFCCVVLDAYSRTVVGWSIDDQQAASLVMNALQMAIGKRKPDGGIVHCDHGSQGGFNWSSQRSMREGCDGQAGWLDEGVDGSRSDEVAGTARGRVADGSGGVLVGDRRRVHDDGRGRVGRSVGAGGRPVVPQRWRDARCHLRAAVGALFVV
jgi:putative transposase